MVGGSKFTYSLNPLEETPADTFLVDICLVIKAEDLIPDIDKEP